MATKRGNPDQYLQKVGGTYYARVRVPRTLEKYTGQTHIRRSLGTGSRAEANLAKHSVVSRIKAELADLRKSPPKTGEAGLSFADAKAMREQILELQAKGDHETVSTWEMVTLDRAESLERLVGTEKARKWYRAATQDDETLSELMDKWLSVSDYKESTKAGHRKALDEVLGFVKDKEAHPSDVGRKVAMNYIDDDLTQRGLAHSTIRDRLVSLGGFWSWMASRNAVSKESNPWTGHKVSKKQNAGTRPPKRAYTEDEVLRLLAGNDTVKRWPTYSYLPDLIVLGMFTGAREDELCSLTIDDIEASRSQCMLHIADSKTKAGIRFVGVTHTAPLAVIKRRIAGRKGADQLFPELKPGGLDEKLSASAVKAFGRYRRACGVPDGTDFHSFRRNVITILEAAGVGQVSIARFVGHKVGTLAADTYSSGGSKTLALEVAREVRYGKGLEASAEALSEQKSMERKSSARFNGPVAAKAAQKKGL